MIEKIIDDGNGKVQYTKLKEVIIGKGLVSLGRIDEILSAQVESDIAEMPGGDEGACQPDWPPTRPTTKTTARWHRMPKRP